MLTKVISLFYVASSWVLEFDFMEVFFRENRQGFGASEEKEASFRRSFRLGQNFGVHIRVP